MVRKLTTDISINVFLISFILQGVIERKKKLAMEAFLATRDVDNNHVLEYDTPLMHSENRLNKTRISNRLSNDRFTTASSSSHSFLNGGSSGGTNDSSSSCSERDSFTN